MKTLVAEKVRDGWYVRITTTQTVARRDDVEKIIKQKGLRMWEGYEPQKDIYIYAD